MICYKLRHCISLAFTLALATSWLMDVSASNAPDLTEPEELRGEGLRTLQVTPIWGCDGNGGACQCAVDGAGTLITMNRFFGDANDMKVDGCGGAFALNGASMGAQWGGSQDGNAINAGIDFSQGKSYLGWEGCCYVCGANLQLAGRLSSGWFCEKDAFSTGIWLKGVGV